MVFNSFFPREIIVFGVILPTVTVRVGLKDWGSHCWISLFRDETKHPMVFVLNPQNEQKLLVTCSGAWYGKASHGFYCFCRLQLDVGFFDPRQWLF